MIDALDTPLTTLARWSASLRFDDIPDAVLDVARRCAIDTVAVTLAGSATRVARQARAVAMTTARAGNAGLIGGDASLCAPAAASVNAIAGHALDFDDNCNAGFVHGSVVIWPAALAVAQLGDLPGARLLAAFVVGAECQYALAELLTRSVYDQGWWTTGLLGTLGACAAACHGLGLDAERTAHAMGIALAGSGGLKAGFGTDAKTLMAGRASEAGVLAALLAAQGCSGPLDIVEHPRGLAAMFAGAEVTPIKGLGCDWKLLSPGVDIKRIPVCLSSHAAVDALGEIMASQRLGVSDIRQIVCDVPALVVQNLTHDLPTTPQHAQFSMPFALACSSVTGDLTLDSLSQATLEDPQIQALMRRIGMHTSARWTDALLGTAPEGAWVKVLTHDGRRFEGFCARHRGSSSQPLTADELRGKFAQCARRVLAGDEAQALLQRLERLQQLPGTRSLFTPLAQPAEQRLVSLDQ
jgi:2-methylcitrate dehydratase PrpD